MIASQIDAHVETLGHMAVYALCPRRACLMPVMIMGIEAGGLVALRTERIALGDQLSGMYIMAVTTGHTFSVHFTLQKRTHDKYFVVYLAIGKVESLVE